MFRTARFLIVGGGIAVGLSLTGVVWLLGWLNALIDKVLGVWNSFLAWLDDPTFSTGAMAGLGSMVAVVAILAVVFLILTDG